MDKLNAGIEPSPFRRLSVRLVSSVKTWPDTTGWIQSVGVGVLTLMTLGAVGLSTGLYLPHRANLTGMPLRLLTVLFVPAIGEEAVFRGLLVPSRAEVAQPWAPLVLATGIFVAWHLVEAATFLRGAAPLFDRADFLLCAALLGAGCGWMRWRTGSLWPGVTLHWVMVTIWQTWMGGFML